MTEKEELTTLKKKIEQKIINVLKSIFDPEIPVDVYELGLIYEIKIDDELNVGIEMTLTSPNCPVAGQMPEWVEQAVNRAGHDKVRVNLTFEPPWTKEYVSEDGLLALGM